MHALNWFEIPCTDLERATKFYETVLDLSLTRFVDKDVPQSIFPGPAEAVRGALIQDKNNTVSPKGVVIYLDANGKLEACLARVAKQGGEVVVPKTDISPNGFIAIVRDTEGNRVGLHSRA